MQPDPRLVESIFTAALDRPSGADRTAYLDSACSEQPDLRRRVEALLQAHQEASGFLEPATPTVSPEGGATAVGSRGRYFGDYELIEEIARGGMGVVYKARQISLNRVVALKMILAGQLASESDVQRFRQEAEAAANLDHPNILPIYEVGEHEGQHYFAMKLVEGGSLAQHLGRFRDNPRSAAGLIEQLARAVHHAHQRGILHRDLKPGNILLEWRGGEPQPLLTDFGLAKRLEGAGAMTQSGALVGTPEYMAPEQARGQKGLTTAVDVYALGAILYALLTGRSPFESDNVVQTLRDVMEAPPASPRSLNPGVPRDLAVVCLKCLEKEEGRRYASAEALADDLRRFVENRPIVARRASGAERLARWARRNPVVAALTGGMAVLALAFLGAAVGAAVYLSGVNADLKKASEDAAREAEHAQQALGRESEALQKEAEERKRAAAAADLAQQRLGSLYVENGLRAEGPAARLPWFAEALRWDHENPQRAEAHRLRLLAHLPEVRPELSLPFPSGVSVSGFLQSRPPLPSASYSPARRYAVISGSPAGEPKTDVWDLTTGERIFQDKAWAVFCLDDRRLLLHEGGWQHWAQLWDLEKRQPLTPRLDMGTTVAPGGRRLIGLPPLSIENSDPKALPRRLTVWSTDSGQELFPINLDFSPWYVADRPGVSERRRGLRMSFEDNGKEGVVVFENFEDGQYRAAAWDLETGQPVERKKAPGPAPDPNPSAEMELPLGTEHLLLATNPSFTPRLYPSPFMKPYGRIVDRLTRKQVFPPPEWGLTRMVLSPDQKTALVYRSFSAPLNAAGLLLGSANPLGLAANVRAVDTCAEWQAWDWQAGKPRGPAVAVPGEVTLGSRWSFPGGTPPEVAPAWELLNWGFWERFNPAPAWMNHFLLERAGRTLRTYDLTTGQTFQAVLPQQAGNGVGRPRLNADGSKLLVAQIGEGPAFTVHVFKMPTLERIGEPISVEVEPQEGGFFPAFSGRQPPEVAFSPDGWHVLVPAKGEGGKPRLFLYGITNNDPPRLQLVRQLAGRWGVSAYDRDHLARVAFSEVVGRFVADVQDDGSVLLLEMPDARPVQTIRPAHPARSPDHIDVSWIDGDTRLLIRNPDAVEIWNVAALYAPEEPSSPYGTWWVSPDGRRRRGVSVGWRQSQPLATEVVESEGESPPRVLWRTEVGWEQGSPIYGFSPDGELLLGLGQVGGEKGFLRAWDARSGRRLPIPERPDGPRPRVLVGGAGRVVGVCGGQALLLGQQEGEVVGPFAVPDDVVGLVPRAARMERRQVARPDGRMVTVDDGPSYLVRRDGRLVRVGLEEPGRSRELPAEVVGVRSVQGLFVPASQVVTRPDDKTIRYWTADLALHPRGELRFAAPVLHVGPWAAVAADGEIALPPEPGDSARRGHVAGGPFRTAYGLGSSGILLLNDDGKPTLVQPPEASPDGSAPKERFAASALAGTVREPVLEATRLVNQPGRTPATFVAVRTGGAVHLWGDPARPPQRFPRTGESKQVAFCRPSGLGYFVLTEDADGVALWEVGGGDKPVLTVPGTFSQVVPHPYWPAFAVRLPDGQVVFHALAFDAGLNRWQARETVTWDVKAAKLILKAWVDFTQPDKPGPRGSLFAVTEDGSVRGLDLATGKLDDAEVRAGGPVDRVEILTHQPASPNNAAPPPEPVRRLMTAGPDGTVRLWARKGKAYEPVGEAHHLGGPVADVSPVMGGPLLLVVPERGRSRLIDLADGKKVRDFATEEGAGVRPARGSYDGSSTGLLITHPDGSLQTWPLGSPRPSPRVTGAGPVVHEVPSGAFEDLLLAYEGKTARLFSGAGVLVAEVEASSKIKQGLLLPQGFQPLPRRPLVLAGEDGTCELFDPLLGHRIADPIRPAGGLVAVIPLDGSLANLVAFLVVGGREVFGGDAAGRTKPLVAFDQPVTGVTYLPSTGGSPEQGPYVLLHFAKEVRRFRVEYEAGKPVWRLGAAWPHDDEVTGAWAGRIGYREVVTTRAGKAVRCWGVADDKPLGPPVTVDEEVLWARPVLLAAPPNPPTQTLGILTPTGYQLWSVARGTLDRTLVTFPFGPLRGAEETGRWYSQGTLLLLGKDGTAWRFNSPADLSNGPAWSYQPRQLLGEGYETLHPGRRGDQLLTLTTFGTLQDWTASGGTLRPGKLRLTGLPRTRWGTSPGAVVWELVDGGRGLIVARPESLERWEVAEGRRVWAAELPLNEAGFHLLAGERRVLTVQPCWADKTRFDLPPSNHVVRLWDAETGRALTDLHESPAEPRITPDGKHLLLASGTGEGRTIRAWSIETGEAVTGLDLPGDPWRSEVNSPDWRFYAAPVAGVGPDTKPVVVGYRVHDSRTKKALTPILKGESAAFSADGRYLRVGPWDQRYGQQVYALPSGQLIGPAPVWMLNQPAPADSSSSLRGAALGWTWSPAALEPGNEALLAAAGLLSGRRMDEGGEFTALTPEEAVVLRKSVDAVPAILRRQREQEARGELSALASVPDGPKLEAAVEALRPDDLELLARVVNFYLRHDRIQEAAAVYDRAIARNPSNAVLKARRSRIKPGVVGVWNFDAGPAGWGSPNQCTVSVSDGVLQIQTTGDDPWVTVPVAGVAGWQELTLHVRVDQECHAQLFWATEQTRWFAEERSVFFDVKPGKGEWAEVKVRFRADSALTALRLDPVPGGRVRWEVDAATLAHSDPPPK